MLLLTLALFAPVALETPRYADEALRVEVHTDRGRLSKVFTIRHMGSDVVKVDYINTTWSGSHISTFNLSDCPSLMSQISASNGPKLHQARNRAANGSPVIVPDGPNYRVVAKERYASMLGVAELSGDSLSAVGQWASAALATAEVCRAP